MADRPEATGPYAAARPVPLPPELTTDPLDALAMAGFGDLGMERLT
jgi:hypothetical protein